MTGDLDPHRWMDAIDHRRRLAACRVLGRVLLTHPETVTDAYRAEFQELGEKAAYEPDQLCDADAVAKELDFVVRALIFPAQLIEISTWVEPDCVALDSQRWDVADARGSHRWCASCGCWHAWQVLNNGPGAR